MRVRGTVVVALAAFAVLSAVPASAGPPDRFEAPVFFVFRDPETRFIVFVNITNEDACAWEAGGFEGPPPVEKLVTEQVKETGQGLVNSFQAEAVIEIWRLPEPGVDVDSCELLDDGPWATGRARFGFTANFSETRTSSFGGHTQGTVVDVDGQAWTLSSTGRFQFKESEEIVRAEHFTLTKRGS